MSKFGSCLCVFVAIVEMHFVGLKKKLNDFLVGICRWIIDVIKSY